MSVEAIELAEVSVLAVPESLTVPFTARNVAVPANVALSLRITVTTPLAVCPIDKVFNRIIPLLTTPLYEVQFFNEKTAFSVVTDVTLALNAHLGFEA